MDVRDRSALNPRVTRRQLIKGFAAAGAATWIAGHPVLRALAAPPAPFHDFTAIAPSSADAVQVPTGYVVDLLIKWGDEFGEGLTFGYNCDYTAYFPLHGNIDGILWVNHEYVIPYFVSDWRSSQDPTWDPTIEPYRSIMANEKDAVGGSLLRVRRRPGGWEVFEGSQYNRRLSPGGVPIPYDGPVAGSGLVPEAGAVGTLANCSGGHTPWGTVLSAEENYQSYGLDRFMPFNLGWDHNGDPDYFTGEVQPQPPGPNARNAYGDPAVETPNYGYILEVDPYTGAAVRHTALGRLHHENVTMRVASDGRIVAYTGDDAPAADGMLFKFVSTRRYRQNMPRSEAMSLLADGQLYVAQFIEGSNNPAIDSGTGKWHPIDMEDPEALAFTTAWIRANLIPAVGGSTAQFHVPRAEDCEIVPGRPRDILVALTSARGLPADPASYGLVRLVREASANPGNLDFTWQNLLEGGPSAGFAAPDNLAFSAKDRMWLSTDISTSSLNTPNFAFHANNALFYVPLAGPNANVAFRFANAPIGAELTGPTFVPGSRTLFLSVQHPGENTPVDAPISTASYTSWWPEGNKTTASNPSKPKPSVLAIRKVS